jgi:hypothetical protein
MLDAVEPPLKQHLLRLVAAVQRLLRPGDAAPEQHYWLQAPSSRLQVLLDSAARKNLELGAWSLIAPSRESPVAPSQLPVLLSAAGRREIAVDDTARMLGRAFLRVHREILEQ